MSAARKEGLDKLHTCGTFIGPDSRACSSTELSLLCQLCCNVSCVLFPDTLNGADIAVDIDGQSSVDTAAMPYGDHFSIVPDEGVKARS